MDKLCVFAPLLKFLQFGLSLFILITDRIFVKSLNVVPEVSPCILTPVNKTSLALRKIEFPEKSIHSPKAQALALVQTWKVSW